MILLWRMHKFVRDVGTEWGEVNGGFDSTEEFNTPTLLSVKKTYAKRRKWLRWRFTDKEVSAITRAVAISSFCTISDDKIDLTAKGVELSSFSGYIEEFIKRHKRIAVALGALALFLIVRYI